MSSAITIFLKQSVGEQAIPFTIKENNLNPETLEAINEIESGKIKGPFKNVADLMRSLNA